MKIKKYSVLINWLISYLIIIFIFTCVTVLVYRQSRNVVLRQIDSFNSLQLRRASENIDNVINNAKNIGSQITLSKHIRPFLNVGPSLSNHQRYDALTLIENLRLYESSGNLLSRVAIYLKEPDVLITTNGIMKSRTFFHIEYGESETGYQHFLNLFNNKTPELLAPTDFRSPERSGETGDLVYIRGLLYNKPYDLSVSVLITIDQSQLFHGVYDKTDTSSILNVLHANKLLASTGYLSGNTGIDFAALTDPSANRIKQNGKNLVISTFRSPQSDLTYLSIVQEDTYLDQFRYIRTIALCSILGTILLMVLLVLYFLSKNYAPIKGLMHFFQDESLDNAGGNEYAIIGNAISKTLSEKQLMDYEIEKKNRILKRRFVDKLLRGQVDDVTYIRNRFAEFEIALEQERMVVLLLCVQDYNSAADVEGDSFSYRRDEVQLILTNVFEELTNERYRGYMGELDDDLIACLVNIGDADALQAKQNLLTILEQPKELIESQFSIQYIGALSTVCESVADIHRLYNEARKTIKYMQTMGVEQAISFEDIEQSNEAARYYPRSAEQHLINFVKAGDYRRTIEIVNELFDKNFDSGRQPSVQLVESLAFDLVITLAQVISEVGNDALREQFDPVKRLLPCGSLQNMKDSLSSYLEELCAHMARQNIADANWIQRDIIPYIQLHSNDINLNVSSLAEAFGVHPVHLSRVFKEETGESTLDCINRLRIEKGKQILREKKINIEDVATMIGFSNVRTFSRVFKKYEGITPGKFKELNAADDRA